MIFLLRNRYRDVLCIPSNASKKHISLRCKILTVARWMFLSGILWCSNSRRYYVHYVINYYVIMNFSYAGAFIQYVIPVALVYCSRRVIKTVFGDLTNKHRLKESFHRLWFLSKVKCHLETS